MASGREYWSEIWDSGVLVEHVWGTVDLFFLGGGVNWCTCDFPEIGFSKKCFFDTSDSFTVKFKKNNKNKINFI